MSTASLNRDQDSKTRLSFPPLRNGKAFIRAQGPGHDQDCLVGYAERAGRTWTAYLWGKAVRYYPAIVQDDQTLNGLIAGRNPSARATLKELGSLRGKESLRDRARQHIADHGRWWQWPDETGDPS